MRIGGLFLAIAIAAAGCGGSKPTETVMVSGRGAGDGPVIGGDGVGAGAPVVAGASCSESNRQVIEDNRWCICAQPCSGAEPEVPPPSSWQCMERDPACPVGVPTAGSACPRPGLGCGYGYCGGTSAQCGADRRWLIRDIEPPA